MKIEMLQAKIHRATVTDANLDYVGSITIDQDLLDAAGILVGQRVSIVNINNGARFDTYTLKGERGKGDICLNGAAARLVEKKDKVIIIAYASMTPEEAKEFEPSIVFVDEANKIQEIGE